MRVKCSSFQHTGNPHSYPDFQSTFFVFVLYALVSIASISKLKQCYPNRFGKGWAREGKNLSSKGFSFPQYPF